MMNTLKTVLTIAVMSASFILTGCSSSLFNTQPSVTKQIASKSLLEQQKQKQFTEKMMQANIAVKLLNNDKAIQGIFEDDKLFTKAVAECSKKNAYVTKLPAQLEEAFGKLAANNPAMLDVWLPEMDFLIEKVSYIEEHPKEVSFDIDNLVNSTAFELLSVQDASRLQALIEDRKFSPVMQGIGLPFVNAEGKLVDSLSYHALLVFSAYMVANMECSDTDATE